MPRRTARNSGRPLSWRRLETENENEAFELAGVWIRCSVGPILDTRRRLNRLGDLEACTIRGAELIVEL